MKRKFLIRYIYEKIGDIDIECRCDILNHIAINCGQNIIYESNIGSGILFDELDNKIL